MMSKEHEIQRINHYLNLLNEENVHRMYVCVCTFWEMEKEAVTEE